MGGRNFSYCGGPMSVFLGAACDIFKPPNSQNSIFHIEIFHLYLTGESILLISTLFVIIFKIFFKENVRVFTRMGYHFRNRFNFNHLKKVSKTYTLNIFSDSLTVFTFFSPELPYLINKLI